MNFTTPKLADCQQHGPGSELYIVEGDSAARTVMRIRDSVTQAVLPMQGKPVNAFKASAETLYGNVHFGVLLNALQVDLGEINPPASVRYEKIILLFDPDADGIHARTLMLLFFYRWLPDWLAAGRICDAHAPQWMVTGDQLEGAIFASTPDHLGRVKDHLRQQGVADVRTKRFRGLGSIDVEILKSRCVDRKTRDLSVLTHEHAENALALFDQLRRVGKSPAEGK